MTDNAPDEDVVGTVAQPATTSDAEHDLGYYIHRNGSASMLDGAHDASPIHELFEGIDAQAEIGTLLAMLDRDGSAETRAALQSEHARQAQAFAGHWFQRIDFPSLAFSSTLDHATAFIDEGGTNTLGRRLDSTQASPAPASEAGSTSSRGSRISAGSRCSRLAAPTGSSRSASRRWARRG